jgi:hypothetical protein
MSSQQRILIVIELFFSGYVLEIVLSLLIESFRFAPSKKEIFWQTTTVVTPTVLGEGGKIQLPLQVTRVDLKED